MPRLFVLTGPDLGKIHSFEGQVRLGRTSECDVIVHGPSISRVHAQLTPEDDAWVLVDLDSSNGVYLGSIRAKRFELSDGDVFRLGKIELRFRMEVEPVVPDSVEQAPAPPPAPPEPAPAPAELEDEEPEDDELFLEEDIDLGEASDAGSAHQAPTSPPPSPVTPAPQLDLGVGGAPPRSEDDEERRRVLQAAARGRTADVTDRREREIIQFSSHRSESSAMTSDLSQHPLWVRLLAVLLALGVSAAVFWFAFRGASSLRGETGIDLDPGVEFEDEY